MMKCERRTQGSDMVNGPCPQCGHSTLVHPGLSDQKNLLTECVVCALARLKDSMTG
jgi:hypothetical protein